VLTGPLVVLIDSRRVHPGTSRFVVVVAVVTVIVLPLQCIALWKVLRQQFGEQRRLKRVRRTLEQVIAGEELQIAFQPIAAVSDGRPIGVEALARFPVDPPEVTDTGAGRWFYEARQVGLEREFDLLAVRRALTAATALPKHLYVSINVSPNTLAAPELLSELVGGELSPDRLVIEITEHLSIEDYVPLQAARLTLRERGIRLAVDDAGAGFASFRHIVALAPDVLKIDRTIVAGIDRDPARSALVASLVMFARDSGIATVGEGVETIGELHCLDSLGVQAAQGHLTGRPSVRPADWAGWG
jgi:EAL domain-containing protein (putative c-di-GMP-specific phosphodiesterase class I)